MRQPAPHDGGKATFNDMQTTLGVLVRLVRDEFPPERSLIEIARIWGNATPAEMDALRSVEAMLGGD
jgi:hypothetical protein